MSTRLATAPTDTCKHFGNRRAEADGRASMRPYGTKKELMQVHMHSSDRCRGLCHGNSIKHAWRAEARDASCHSNGILPLCSGFGSEDPKGGSRDEVALKVEGVVDRTMHVQEALGGSS
jgi:hypothetical protein